MLSRNIYSMFTCLVDSLSSNRLQSYKLEYIKCIHILRGGFQLVKYVFSNFAPTLIRWCLFGLVFSSTIN